jgi:hypothetical protein
MDLTYNVFVLSTKVESENKSEFKIDPIFDLNSFNFYFFQSSQKVSKIPSTCCVAFNQGTILEVIRVVFYY